MNRNRSSESLSSNGSSSPTDFTSDDEIRSGDFIINSSKSLDGSSSRSLRTITINRFSPSNKSNNYYPPPSASSSTHNYPHQGSHYRHQQPLFEDTIQAQMNLLHQNNQRNSSPFDSNESSTKSSGLASDDYNKNHHLSSSSLMNRSNSPITYDKVLDILGDDSLWPNQYSGNQFKNNQQRAGSWNRRGTHLRGQASQSTSSFNNNNVFGQSRQLRANDNENLDDDLMDEENDDADLFGKIDSTSNLQEPLIDPLVSSISSSNKNRGMHTIATRMCYRLVECRNLIDAIEFVERNRDLIDNLTRIITHDAPAFRNYDLNNYQIDYSVKESFNPNFWLDREPVITTADGNCQYHAISLSLTGSELYTPEVKLATAVAVIDNREWFDSMLKLIDRGSVLDLVHTIARNYSWGDETTLKAVAVAINKRIFLYTCNIGKKDYEMVKLLSKEELLDAFREKKYRGGTGIHTYADPLIHVPSNNYIMLFHKSEHFIAVLPTNRQQLTIFEPYNPIVPVFN